MATDENGRRIRSSVAKRTGRGVYWREERQCWVARIVVTLPGRQEKNIHLGHFDKEKDALKARALAEENLKQDRYFYTPELRPAG
jgi:AP2 domain